MEISPNADSNGAPNVTEIPAPARKATATQFLLKGLAISLPPILTLVILAWIGQIIYGYVVRPITTGVRFVIAEVIDQSRPTSKFVRPVGLPPLDDCGDDYRLTRKAAREFRARIEQARRNPPPPHDAEPKPPVPPEELAEAAYVPFGEWSVPYTDFEEVADRLRPSERPATATGLYMELVTIRYFKSLGSLSALAIGLTIAGLYFLGRFVTARMGQWVLVGFESRVLGRLPIINSVYSSIKQVTDFFFSERPIAYNRVIAVEYPRRGIWTLGFATGDTLIEMTLAAGEPMISVMIPASPLPMTGVVISVPKSAVIDLNCTLDQAFQYYLSCGVLVPEQQRATPELLHRELSRRLAESLATGPLSGNASAASNTSRTIRPSQGRDAQGRDAPGRDAPPIDGQPRDGQPPTDRSADEGTSSL